MALVLGVVSLAVVIFTAAMAWRGLDSPLVPRAPAAPTAPASRAVDVRSIADFPLKPLWTYDIPSEIQLSLSPDGKYILASRSYDRSDGWRNLGFAVLSDRGTLLWQKEYLDPNLRYGAAAIGLDGRIHISNVYYAAPGTLYAFEVSGGQVYAKAVEGEQQIITTERPDRLGVVEVRRGRFTVLDEAGREVSTQTVAPGDLVTYSPGSDRYAHLETGGGAGAGAGAGARAGAGAAAEIMDLDGRTVARVQLSGPPKNIAVARGGKAFAVTVGGAAPAAVLLFDGKGAKLAQAVLEGDGKLGLAFSPDGETLVVFDVGAEGGLQLFDAATGKLKWQLALLPLPGRKVIVKGVTFLPSRQGMLVDYVETYRSPQYGEDHGLLLVNAAGVAVRRARLGQNVDVRLDAGGTRLVTGTNNLMAEKSDEMNNTISYFRLDTFVAAGQK